MPMACPWNLCYSTSMQVAGEIAVPDALPTTVLDVGCLTYELPRTAREGQEVQSEEHETRHE
jgi:hypothetical protein